MRGCSPLPWTLALIAGCASSAPTVVPEAPEAEPSVLRPTFAWPEGVALEMDEALAEQVKLQGRLQEKTVVRTKGWYRFDRTSGGARLTARILGQKTRPAEGAEAIAQVSDDVLSGFEVWVPLDANGQLVPDRDRTPWKELASTLARSLAGVAPRGRARDVGRVSAGMAWERMQRHWAFTIDAWRGRELQLNRVIRVEQSVRRAGASRPVVYQASLVWKGMEDCGTARCARLYLRASPREEDRTLVRDSFQWFVDGVAGYGDPVEVITTDEDVEVLMLVDPATLVPVETKTLSKMNSVVRGPGGIGTRFALETYHVLKAAGVASSAEAPPDSRPVRGREDLDAFESGDSNLDPEAEELGID